VKAKPKDLANRLSLGKKKEVLDFTSINEFWIFVVQEKSDQLKQVPENCLKFVEKTESL